jgi:glycosyltransferase involved in cell wall biosynthesis
LKIGILVPGTSGGGAEFVALQWAEYLGAEGNEVVLLTLSSEPSSPLYANVVLAGKGAAGRLRSLRNFVTNEGPDVLLSLMPYFNILALIAVKSSPSCSVATVISGRNMDYPFRSLFGVKFRAIEMLARCLYRRADGFVAISHPVAAEAIVRYKVASTRVFVVPNPAMGKVANQVPALLTKSKQSDCINLVVPARLVAQKRPILAIDVAVELRKHGFEVAVTYFGAGPLQNDVRRAAESAGVRVDFAGWVDNWFNQCPVDAVVLLPSITEGFGNVLVEAAASGLKSVASSRCLGAADAIVPGITGVLTMGDSAVAYADGVREARQIDVSRECVDNWLRRFSVVRSGELLFAVLAETAAIKSASVGSGDLNDGMET